MLKPRNTLQGTQAERTLLREFFREYLNVRVRDGEDRQIVSAYAVFTEEGIYGLRHYLREDALATPVILTERLSNRVLAVYLTEHSGMRLVAVNTRFKADPDVLAHTLLEEYAHTQQVLDNVDFATQRQQFGYHERPYEQEAKRIATEILGYFPDDYETYLQREEPVGILYDRKES